MKRKIPLGIGIGVVVSLFYVLAIAGRYESVDAIFAPLFFLQVNLCQRFGEMCFGSSSSEGGMLFILPIWIVYGAISGATVSGFVCLTAHLRNRKENTEPAA